MVLQEEPTSPRLDAALRRDFKFLPLSFDAQGLEDLRPFFDDLPADPYIEGRAYRLRRLSAVYQQDGELHSEKTVLKQGYENNMFANVPRVFPELDHAMTQLPAFKAIVRAYVAATGVPEGTRIDAHAIRTVAQPGAPGDPAPEGIHRDGRALVGIFCCARTRLSGGVTELHSCLAGDETPLFRAPLLPGEGVLVNDRLGEGVFHYTGPIEAAEPPADGHRDVIVLLVG